MAIFNAGDKVVRQEHYRDGQWAISCAQNDRAADEVFTVESAAEGDISLCGVDMVWDASCFRLATGLEAELRKCCGTVADKPNLEKVVKQLSDEVTELKHTIDVQDQDLAEAESKLKSIKEYASIADRQRTEAEDLRDAAVAAAKSLGDEVQKLREDRRMWRMNAAEWDGLFMALSAGVEDIDLGQLVTQLDQIGRMADEQGNGADARLCFDAAQVVAMVEHTLDKLLDE